MRFNKTSCSLIFLDFPLFACRSLFSLFALFLVKFSLFSLFAKHERIVDVAVDTHSYRTRHANEVRNPPRSCLGVALAREREKELKYARLQLGARFVPFAIDATGRMGPTARRFVEEMFSVDETTEVRKNTAVYLEARLGIACMKANGSVVERGIKTVAAQGRGVVRVEQDQQAANLA